MKDRMLKHQKVSVGGERPLGDREQLCWKRFLRDAIHITTREHLMKTWKGMSYQVHLERTIDVLEDFGYGENTLEGWRRKVAMAFHDITEDCGWIKNDVKAVGESSCGISRTDALHVANIVFSLQDEKGANRKERKPDKLYQEMAAHKDNVICKLCDRIVNREQDGSMKDSYQDEYPRFREMLYVPGMCDNLWDYVDELHEFSANKKK